MATKIDTIALGGSAGSFTALKSVLAALPADLPAAVLVCQHVSASHGTVAPDLLSAHSALPIRVAEDMMPIEAGHVYFAAPDAHMMIGDGHLHLRRGAHENNFRPAIDPLFRSAAVYRASRAVGVVLSGLMDDGAAGARAMARTGARIVVQDPGTAEFPDMPAAAIRAVPHADVVPLAEIGPRLAALAGTACLPPEEIPWDIGIELKIAGLEGASMANEDRLGTLSPYNCPHCSGVLWEIEDGPLIRFRCHTGHGYTMQSLSAAQEEALDKGLFDTLRAHRGRAALLRQMIAQSTGLGAGQDILRTRARLVEEDAARLEEIIRQRRAG